MPPRRPLPVRRLPSLAARGVALALLAAAPLGADLRLSAPDALGVEREIAAVVERLRREPVTAADLDRARTKLRAGLYGNIGSSTRFGLVDLLASFALFDEDPGRINRLEDEFAAVTPELVQRVAREYLRPTNRPVVELLPGRADAAAGGAPATSLGSLCRRQQCDCEPGACYLHSSCNSFRYVNY